MGVEKKFYFITYGLIFIEIKFVNQLAITTAITTIGYKTHING